MAGECRISLKHEGWAVDVEGSPEFVEKHIERFARSFSAPGLSTPATESTANGQRFAHGGDRGSAFENVLAVHDDRVHVLKEIPGSTRAEKMVSAALILAFANDRRGQPNTSFDEISALCEEHGCLDRTNLSKSLKTERESFIFTGSIRKQFVSLTVPGRRRAEQLLGELNSM